MSCSPFRPERLLRLVDTEDWHAPEGPPETRRDPEGPTALTDDDFERIVGGEKLLWTFQERTALGGRGAGLDGVGPQNVTTTEAGAICRELSELIHNGSYRPQPTREVSIPKSDGGTRVLRVRSVFDRAIARAVVDALEPVTEQLLLDGVMGFRPRRGVWTLLARLSRSVAEGRAVVMQADISQAFDHVPIDRAVEAFNRVIDSPVCWPWSKRSCAAMRARIGAWESTRVAHFRRLH